MNLPRSRSHLESKSFVCFCCMVKDVNCYDLRDQTALRKLVIQFVDHGFNPEINSIPTGLCKNCKTHLYNKKVSNAVFFF